MDNVIYENMRKIGNGQFGPAFLYKEPYYISLLKTAQKEIVLLLRQLRCEKICHEFGTDDPTCINLES